MSIDILKKRLKENNINGIYLFYGDEEYTKDFYIDSFKKQTGNPDFSCLSLDGDSLEIQELYDFIEAPAYFSGSKLAVVRDMKPDKGSTDDVINILNMLPENISVVFLYRASMSEELTGKKKSSVLFKYISDNGITVEFPRETPEKLRQWITRHFKSKNIAYEPETIDFLIEYCGNDMYVLLNEINKLAAYFSGVPVNKSDIENICCANESYRIFDLGNAVASRNIKKSMKILSTLVYEKTPPEMILASISGCFNEMYSIKTGIIEGKTIIEMKTALNIPDWKIKKHMYTVKNTDVKYLSFAIGEILSANRRIVSTQENSYTVIEFLINRITAYGT